jgi:acetyltransferase-like isoleucine patch superfamily enzyme
LIVAYYRRLRSVATWPLRRLLFRGRIVDCGASVPVSLRYSVRRTGKVTVGAGTYVFRGAIGTVEGHLEIGPDSVIKQTERFHVGPDGRMRTGARLTIEPGARIIVFGELSIGDDVYVGRDAVIVARTRVEIGSGTLLGERVSIHDEDHGPPDDRQAFKSAPVRVEPRVWIGAGVVITGGASVGRDTTVGANAVVTGAIPASVMAGGVPARVIKRLT